MTLTYQNKEWSDRLENEIKRFCRNVDENYTGNKHGERLWDEPVVGYANGDDPVFDQLKKDIGPFYWTPLEIFIKTFPETGVLPENLTVISWILPQTEATKADHRKETEYPSERWAISRLFGEKFNNWLREHVVELLQNSGIDAVAPVLSPHWGKNVSKRYGFASTWSERHAAYAAGLGTFGLCDGLITPLGKAIRCGSVVANISIQPAGRPYSDHHAYCLFYSKGTCKECIQRCPAGAISEKGHEKALCHKYLRQVAAPYTQKHYGLEVNNCGLCQTRVPCESQIPDIE
jgi:epoxyqueuosine reductase QueG